MSSSTRGRAGKFQKAKRGGGRNFSKNLRPIGADGVEKSMWAEPDQNASEEDSSEEESSEESSGDDEAPKQQEDGDMTREQRRAAAKAKKEAAIKKKQGTAQPGDMPPSSSDDEDEEEEVNGDMPANPNHSAASRKQAAKAVVEPDAAKEPTKVKKGDDLSQLSRREREALQAQQSKERYQKLHAEGKTDEARADLERLKLVRQQREEAAAQKAAEKQEREMIEKEKKEQLERMDRQAKLKAARGGKASKKGGKS